MKVGSIGSVPSAAVTQDPDAWKQDGLCRQVDPEVWFPEKGQSTQDAKRICADCPVAAECLAYAIKHDERFGVWGGKSWPERRAVTRPARLEPAPKVARPAAERPARLKCGCGLEGCKGLVVRSTRDRHHELAAKVRRVAA